MTAITDLSFVIITRNESHGIAKCLASICALPLERCEVICVDADSSDDTADIIKESAKKHPYISLYRCRGYLNAAVGRRVGLTHATATRVFFLDGDTEINERFIRTALAILESDDSVVAVTGSLDEVVYNHDYSRVICARKRTQYKATQLVYHSGGSFLARTQAAQTIGSWDIRLTSSEDRDFIARLWSVGKVLAIQESRGTHHTRAYEDVFGTKLAKRHYFCLGILLRKHFWDRNQWMSILREDPAPFLGMSVYLLAGLGALVAAVFDIPIWSGLLPALLVGAVDFTNGLRRGKKTPYRLFSRYVRPFYMLVGALGRFPASMDNVQVERLV
jgi:glycosyltransferase involved in cell wall biosynthesis